MSIDIGDQIIQRIRKKRKIILQKEEKLNFCVTYPDKFPIDRILLPFVRCCLPHNILRMARQKFLETFRSIFKTQFRYVLEERLGKSNVHNFTIEQLHGESKN